MLLEHLPFEGGLELIAVGCAVAFDRFECGKCLKSRLKIENDGKGAYGKDVLDNGNYRVKLHPHPSPMSGDQTDTEMVENVQC